MSTQILVTDSNGREVNPTTTLPVMDLYKNLVPLDPINIATAGVQYGALYFPTACAPFCIQFVIYAKSGTTTDPEITLSITDTSADLLSATTLFGLSASGVVGSVYTMPISGMLPPIAAGTPINLNVVTGSGGTCTVAVKILASEVS